MGPSSLPRCLLFFPIPIWDVPLRGMPRRDRSRKSLHPSAPRHTLGSSFKTRQPHNARITSRPAEPQLGRTGVSHQPSHNWLPARMHHHNVWHGLLDVPCLCGVSCQGVPGRLRTSTGWWGGKQRDMAKGSRKELISGCALAKWQEKSLPTASRCQGHLGRKSSIHDLCHCRAWSCGHCHSIPFLACLQVPGNVSVHTWSSRPMYGIGLSSYLPCTGRTWVWRRASGLW